ncbi:MAG: glutamate synthase subunit beta [Halioglobus sp.]
MSNRRPDGYLRFSRQAIGYREPGIRIKDFNEIYQETWQPHIMKNQGERCMDCGIPTCMSGCPLGNLIPDWNHLVSRDNWREALYRLHATNNFPEFTGYTCPAPCEPACTLAINDEAVTIKSIERSIVDTGWDNGWIVPEPPLRRTPYQVAIVGSGPCGLAAAQQLNRVGHNVTVFERDDTIGGLMTYGIPDFKFAKYQVQRRVKQLAAEGIKFEINTEIGSDLPLSELGENFDAVCLAIGGQTPRDIVIPGRDFDGVEFGLPYLIQENRHQAGNTNTVKKIDAKGRQVLVLGGGDTGADCVATAIRQGADNVIQIDINTKRPLERPAENPWPESPITFERTYAQHEGSTDIYGFEALEFKADSDGRVCAIHGQNVTWRYSSKHKRLDKTVGERVDILADLVLIAIGFSGAEASPFLGDNVKISEKGTIQINTHMQTNLAGIFAAGDANTGQSIVVCAIGEGRDVARSIDIYLTGDSQLPPSLRTRNGGLDW